MKGREKKEGRNKVSRKRNGSQRGKKQYCNQNFRKNDTKRFMTLTLYFFGIIIQYIIIKTHN